MKLVFLNDAMAQCNATDLAAFKATAKKHGCLFERGGIVKIDVETLQTALDAEFAVMADAKKKREVAPNSAGKQIGLVKARLAQVDARLAKKQAKIDIATKAVANAKNRYSRMTAETELAKLRREYDNLVAGKGRDEALLDEMLNGEPESNAQ
jgi:hypothetical protein